MKRGISKLNMRTLNVVVCLAVGGLMAGCAGGGSGGMQMASVGGGCESLRKELAGLDARGVPSIIEAKNAGRSVSSKKQALIDRYNSVLNTYLSSKCHAKR